MAPSRQTSGRRGLVMVGILLVLLLAVADLIRDDSLLRSGWNAVTGNDPATPAERMLRRFR